MNKYSQGMERRLANYFAKALPGLDPLAEREFVSMIMDIADILAKWDLIAEEETRKKVIADEKFFDAKEVDRLKKSALERVGRIRSLEDSGLVPKGTVDRQLKIMEGLLVKTEDHFRKEIELLLETKRYTVSGDVAAKNEILSKLRRLQYEKSIAYVTDYDFARALIPSPILPQPQDLLNAWAFTHECVHDIREWVHDLNNSIFNYYLILVSLNIRNDKERKEFFHGYMMTKDEEEKLRCQAIFRSERALIEQEVSQLNTEVDVIRTFLDDLLTGAFDDTVKGLERHIGK